MIVWSESTFQISSVILSVPQLILTSGAVSYGTLELISLIFVLFLCTCTYYTLLSIKLLDFYQMIPYKNTDEVSLLFVGAYLSKVIITYISSHFRLSTISSTWAVSLQAKEKTEMTITQHLQLFK
jgi:LMBR1-like membrane protein